MNSKILFSGLLVFIFSASSLLFGQCNGMLLSSQNAIDNFATSYPGCTEIDGTLDIKESNPGDITNLNGLAQLTKIKFLKIHNNLALTDLNGLNNLTAISSSSGIGRLQIWENQSLQSLDGLESLEEVTQFIRIAENPSLTSIQGLSNLSNTSTETFIRIEENPSLINLQGLNNISIAYALIINGNHTLVNLNGLDNLTEISSGLEIYNNEQLKNLEGLNNLMNVGDEGIEVYINPELESFNGLENLVSSGGFFISNNSALTNIGSLESLSFLTHSFGISGSPLLTSLNGLENLTQVNTVAFYNNNLLSDISAISNLNMNLLYDLSFAKNSALSLCNYPNICQYLNIPSNGATIYDNAPGCASRQEVLQACGLIGIDENISSENFIIHPNPTNGAFTISGINEGTVQITDSRGRILKTFTLGKDEASLNGLSEGVYFVNVTNEKGSSTKQLVKI